MRSNANTPTPGQPSDRTANLLNLLKFNQPTAQSAVEAQQTQAALGSATSRSISAADLVASFTRKPSSSTSKAQPDQNLSNLLPMMTPTANPTSPSIENSQDMLLRLLNRTQPSQEKANREWSTDLFVSAEGAVVESDRAQVREATPLRVFGTEDELQSSPFEPPQQATKGSVFTFVNPFDQLAASSPRNRTPKPEAVGSKVAILKRPDDGDRLANNVSSNLPASSASTPLPENRIAAPAGIGAGNQASETVAEALSEVAEQADKQVQDALARAEAGGNVYAGGAIENNANTQLDITHMEDVQKAIEIKQEPNDDENRTTLEDTPKPMGKASEDTIDELAHANVADSWESADANDSQGKEEDETTVRVYNFPMRPFVTIDVMDSPSYGSVIREEIVMKIASFKKEFDQVDRTLVTATTNFIVYAMSKNGGFRIIRQDDGSNKQAFRDADNQIYNVALSAARSSTFTERIETALATGVNGSVYWTSIPLAGDATSYEKVLNDRGFIFPPLPSTEEHTSIAQLKTRARKSSRHPEFFAIGRGKFIHIVWPFIAGSAEYTDRQTRVVNSERYINEHCLKIATGKAGKDFTFSEDDTLIVSLDKSGKIKFWDIRELIDPENGVMSVRIHVQVKAPLWTLHTASLTEKSWPTSVQFIDKERPSLKGTALRYLLIGMKQNHTLQLWDLGLGKPVQELNLPHSNETDPICSVVYNAKHAVIIIGHPTRNSIYLVHLSAPRYHLPPISQAKYVQMLAAKDPTIPKPESTAIMSGIRELSLSSIGQLRSLEVLNPPNTTSEELDHDNFGTLFEIYVMHSRGVTCLNLKREDLGWGQDGKPLHGLDAEKEDIIVVKELRLSVSPSGDQMEEFGTKSLETPIKVASKASSKDTIADPSRAFRARDTESDTPKVQNPSNLSPAVIVNGDEKPEQRRKKKSTDGLPSATSGEALPTQTTPQIITYASAAQGASQKAQPLKNPQQATKEAKGVSSDVQEPVTSQIRAPAAASPPSLLPPPSNSSSSASLRDTVSTAIGDAIPTALAKGLSRSLADLYRRIDEDRRVQEAAGAARQDAILRLVSSTLTENVEQSLSHIVATNIEQSVLPAVSNVAATILDRRLSEILTQQLQSTIPRELKLALPAVIGRAMQDPEVLRIISDLVASKVAIHVEKQFAATLQNSITPAFKTLAVNSAQKMTGEVERRVGEQLQHIDIQRHNDNAKMDQLIYLTGELRDTIRGMASVQSDFQNEIVKLQGQINQQRHVLEAAVGSSKSIVTSQAPRDVEIETITECMSTGRHEEGTVMVLLSSYIGPELANNIDSG